MTDKHLQELGAMGGRWVITFFLLFAALVALLLSLFVLLPPNR